MAGAAATLDEAEFVSFAETETWDEIAGGGYVTRGGALVAWRVPRAFPPMRALPHRRCPYRLAQPAAQAARPDTGSAGWRQLAIEVYGGARQLLARP